MEYVKSIKLLNLLHEKFYVTSKDLGISTNALRMKIVRLRLKGHKIYTKRGKGYSLLKYL